MARRRSVDRSARPDPTKAAIVLRWCVRISKDSEVQVTDIATVPEGNPSEWKVADICLQNKIRLVPGRYLLCFSLDEGMTTPMFPKEFDRGSQLKLITAFLPTLAIASAKLSEELARFPSDDEIREGVEEAVSLIFERLMRLEGECGCIPEDIDYSLIRPGCISVIGTECVDCMGLPGQKMPMGEVLHNFLSVFNMLGVSFGHGKAMIQFENGKPVITVGYRHVAHDFVFRKSVNEMLARRFAKFLAEVESELMAHLSRDLMKYFTSAIGALCQISDNYGFAVLGPEPTPVVEPAPEPALATEPVAPIATEPGQYIDGGSTPVEPTPTTEPIAPIGADTDGD